MSALLRRFAMYSIYIDVVGCRVERVGVVCVIKNTATLAVSLFNSFRC